MDTNIIISLLPALILFSISATLTPGPNNILLAYSGANFGFRKTLPHIMGIPLGMTFMHLGMLFGLGKLFQQFDWSVKNSIQLRYSMLVQSYYKLRCNNAHIFNSPFTSNDIIEWLSLAISIILITINLIHRMTHVTRYLVILFQWFVYVFSPTALP